VDGELLPKHGWFKIANRPEGVRKAGGFCAGPWKPAGLDQADQQPADLG
jgi:hypothetical protein